MQVQDLKVLLASSSSATNLPVKEWVMAEEECTNATQKATAKSKTCKVRNDACKD